MIQIICDKCKADCGLNAYDILINALHNPVPHCVHDISSPCATDEHIHIRFTLCQKCYEKLEFPNIYSVNRKGLIFEDEKGE